MTTLGLNTVVVGIGSAEVTGISRTVQAGSTVYFASSTTNYFCKADARISALPWLHFFALRFPEDRRRGPTAGTIGRMSPAASRIPFD